MSTRIAFTEQLLFDLVVDDDEQRLEEDEGLETATAISLFTDRRATPDELKRFGIDPAANRGWPGDSFPEVDGDETGSKLWLLERALRNDETLAFGKQFAEEALMWMLTDQVAKSITVASSWIGATGFMQLDIVIVKTDGTRWVSAWNVTLGTLLQAA